MKIEEKKQVNYRSGVVDCIYRPVSPEMDREQLANGGVCRLAIARLLLF